MRVLIAAFLIAACKPPGAPPFTLRVAVSGPLAPMSPGSELQSWASVLQPCVFETLVGIGADGESVPVLAARSELAGNNSIRLWVRSDARFSDGSPVTFNDVANSIRSAGLRAVEQPGSGILISGGETAAPVELTLAFTYIFRETPAGPIGSGPFRVAEQDAQHLLLVRLARAAGLIDRVRLDSYPTPQDTFAHTLKGDADLLMEVLPRWVEFFQDVPRLRILHAPGITANMIAFNPARLSRQDRSTLRHALSTDDIRKVAFGEDCVPPLARPDFEPPLPGKPLELLALPFLDRFAQTVRRSLAERGDDVRVLELKPFFKELRERRFDLATLRPQVWPAMTVAFWRTGAQLASLVGYSDATVDAAIDARDWAGAQTALAADPPGAVVCTPPSVLVVDSRVRTPPLSAGFVRSLPRWEVAQ